MGYAAINGSASFSQSLASDSQALAADAQSLAKLKLTAGTNSAAAIQETAKQFESLFMRELIKSMRENTMKSGMLDNAGSDLGTDLLDQQYSVQMSGQPGGLSDLIAAQLTRMSGADKGTTAGTAGTADSETTTATDASVATTANSAATVAGTNVLQGAPAAIVHHATPTRRKPSAAQVDFVSRHSAAATDIEKATGIPAGFMLGQAAHETGWGQHEIKLKGGAPSFNLFGIKAGPNWTGKVAEVTTTEYNNGVAEKKVARFRAYDSYEASFRDYASMISNSPRYAKAKAQTSSPQAFASGLQKAGYATDPEYASKLSQTINTTLQLRRAQA